MVAGTAQAEPWTCESACQTPVSSGGSSSQTAAFVGLQWNFGSQTPELTGGIRYLTSTEDEFVYGAQIDAALPLMGESFGPTIRLLGLAGNADVQAQAGAGYDFATALPLLTLGVQTSYFTAGANIELGGAINPYVGINSLAKPTLGSGGELSCDGPNFELTEVVEGTVYGGLIEVDDPSVVVDGQTCFLLV